MNYFENCKTLDEAKKTYWNFARKLHPDMGGSTPEFQELLNQFHNFKPSEEKFSTEFENWDATIYANVLSQLISLEGIIIEIVGSFIWISGDTKPHKETIKAIECGEYFKRGWSRNKSKWYFSPKGYKKKSKKSLSYDEIRDFYGVEKVSKPNGTKSNTSSQRKLKSNLSLEEA